MHSSGFLVSLARLLMLVGSASLCLWSVLARREPRTVERILVGLIGITGLGYLAVAIAADRAVSTQSTFLVWQARSLLVGVAVGLFTAFILCRIHGRRAKTGEPKGNATPCLGGTRSLT